jgi:hypothetical protein
VVPDREGAGQEMCIRLFGVEHFSYFQLHSLSGNFDDLPSVRPRSGVLRGFVTAKVRKVERITPIGNVRIANVALCA